MTGERTREAKFCKSSLGYAVENQFVIAKTPALDYQEPMFVVYYQRSAKEAEREIRAIRAASKKIGKTVISARAFLLKRGFITKDNKVGKRYR